MPTIDYHLLMALMENIPDRIYFKDTEGRFLAVNRAKREAHHLTGEDALKGMTDFDFFTFKRAQESHVDEQRIIATGEPVIGKVERNEMPDGSVIWVSTSKIPLRDEHEKIIGICGISRDITESKKAQDAMRQLVEDLQKSREELKEAQLQLNQAEKMETVGRMAAGIAHEVQNPLQILLMSVDFLHQSLSERTPVVDGVLTEMRAAANRADTIIRGLLVCSHAETLEQKPQDLNALVKNALVLVRHNLASNQITLLTELEEGLPPLALDGTKIEQVFVNLFTNAIDAMPQGGTLTVKSRMDRLAETHRDLGAREAGRYYAGDAVVVVEVEDSGKGIPPETLRKIFDPFFTTKSTGKGTGLGLAIAKGIIDLHRGKIEIQNLPQGGVQVRLMFKTPIK
jgi:PAS domain S-box-containing protein